MASISYLRAAGSCMPFVSPAFSLYNFGELGEGFMPLWERIRDLSPSQQDVTLKSFFSFLSNTPFTDILPPSAERDELARRATVLKKNYQTYNTCTLVGHVLTVAIAVSLFALGVLSGLSVVLITLLMAIPFYLDYSLNELMRLSPEVASYISLGLFGQAGSNAI